MKPADRFFVRLSIARRGVDETAPSRVVWGEGRNASTLRDALAHARTLVDDLEAEIADREFIAECVRIEQTVTGPSYAEWLNGTPRTLADGTSLTRENFQAFLDAGRPPE